MRHAVGLKRLETLEKQDRRRILAAGGVTVVDRLDIGAEFLANRAVFLKGFIDEVAHGHVGHHRAAQFCRQDKAQRVLQGAVIENDHVQEAGQHGLLLAVLGGFHAYGQPNGVIGRLRHESFS